MKPATITTRFRNYGARWLTSLMIFLAVMGPGIITANVDNDAGGITTYSLAGASLGYRTLWLFIPMTLALTVVQEMSARMGAVTGKGLAALMRERYGVKWILIIMLGLVLTNLGNTVSEFAGIAASAELFGVSRYISVPVCALFVWWMVVKGSYKRVERIFLAASALYLSYVISGLLAQPDWGEVSRNLVVPHVSAESGYLAMLIGIVGTTIAPWMQFYIQSAIVEKGITADQYQQARIDVIVGSFMAIIVALFITLACAATLFENGLAINTAKDAAMALQPLAGKWASQLFAFGLFNASVFAASILPLATAFPICEALGFEAGVDKSWHEAPVFYWLYTALVAVGAGSILLPNVPLIPVMFWTQVINGLVLPLVLIMVLDLTNSVDIMGQYTNSPAFNLVARLTAIIVGIMEIMLVITTIFPLGKT